MPDPPGWLEVCVVRCVRWNDRGSYAEAMNTRRIASIAACLAVVGILVGCTSGSVTSSSTAPTATAVVGPEYAAAQQHAQALAAATADRLAVMPDVAYAKFVSGAPVDDPVREEQAAAAFVAATSAGGVPADIATGVINDQFTAAKSVQRSLIAQWTDGTRPVPETPPADLTTELRPRIDAATTALANGLIAVEQTGVPAQWSDIMSAAAAGVVVPTEQGVTRADYDLTLPYLLALPPS